MADDTERLFVQLEARINNFEKQMAKAEKTATKTYNLLSKQSGRATSRMEKDMRRSTGSINKALATTTTQVGSFAKGFLPVLGAGALTGTVAAIGQVARGIADIGREARRAGIDVESFQELGYVAEQNRIPIDALTDGIKELNLRADEFILTGSGSGAEAFQRLGFGADELKEKLKNPRDLFIEIIGKLQQLDRAAQIRISDELFGGTAGERFVELLDEGADKIREQIQEARNLGIVLDAEVIAKAEDIDKKFAIVSRTVGTALKGAIVEAAAALGQFIDKFQDFERQQESTLENRMSELGLKRIDIENKILELKEKQRNVTGALADAERRNIDGTIAGLREQLNALSAEEGEILKVLSSRSTKPSSVPSFQEVIVPSKPTADDKKRERAIASANREREAVSLLIAELQQELALVGASDQAKRAYEASRMAGAAATDAEREQIISLNEALYQGQEAEREYMDAAQNRYDTIRDGLSGIYNDLKNGESFTDAFANAFERMGDRIVSTLIDDIAAAMSGLGSQGNNFGGLSALGGGGGGIWSIISSIGASLLGVPSFAGGGYTGRSPRSGGVDGKGGFPAILHPHETVVDHTRISRSQQERSNNNSQQNVHVTVGVSADNNGNLKPFVESVSQKVSRAAITKAAPSIISVSESKAGQNIANGTYDKSMGRYGAQPKARNIG